MLAVHLENGVVSVQEAPLPETAPGQALIRMRLAGICSTDLHLQRGYYGFAGRPGHEFVGIVEMSPDPRWIGRRVVGEINLACHACDWCARGLERHCPTRTVLGIVKHPGAFAEYLTLPVENLHEVPDSMPDRLAVFTEPVAAACEILDQVDFPEGAEAAVLGDGKLGLLIAQVLQLHGVQVHLYGRHPEKMQLLEPLGVKWRSGWTDSARRYAYVVEATGSEQGLETAVSLTLPRGTLIMKSTVAAKVTIDTAPIIVNEITMIGSRCGRFAPALTEIASGKLILEPMIDDTFALADAPAAFARAASKGVKKVLLQG